VSVMAGYVIDSTATDPLACSCRDYLSGLAVIEPDETKVLIKAGRLESNLQ